MYDGEYIDREYYTMNPYTGEYVRIARLPQEDDNPTPVTHTPADPEYSARMAALEDELFGEEGDLF